MLYCFREAQAAERWAREVTGGQAWRMRVCKSLSEYKQWRPKVAKTQDAGLSDYDLRELNDEIKKQMHEKRHWENQIVALGGDELPPEPNNFGCAKDLAGVRELFQSRSRKTAKEGANAALES
ncbi:Isy1-like splicing factor [Mycena galopus ATCC 62051]|nr:Isy1-like splicing factor [Mycena galopus ATCC 62051]